MLVLLLIGGLLASAGFTIGLMPFVRRFGINNGWLDKPDGKRKVHEVPIPRIGGLAIIAAVSVLFVVIALVKPTLSGEVQSLFSLPSWPILVGAVLMASVGFIDDVRDMHALPKLVAQTVISVLVVVGGLRITVFDAALGGGEVALAVSGVLTVVWVVGTINGVNFIDGMDGLAGGVVAIALVALGGIFALQGSLSGLLVAVIVLGAIGGFLKFNFAPAKIFMGDVGSHFLGYVLAVFALGAPAHAEPVMGLVVAAVAMGLPILDTFVTLFRRPQYDKPLLHSDGDHFHHRLMERYEKHIVIRVLYAVSVGFAVGAVAMSVSPLVGAVAILVGGFVGACLFLYWLGYLPGKYANGPADATRVRFAIEIESDRLATRGDGAAFTEDITELSTTGTQEGGKAILVN